MTGKETYAEEARETRREWDKNNGYYTSYGDEGLCIRCIHFSINHDHITHGACVKIKQALQDCKFAKNGVSDYGVSVVGVCENFTNIDGIGLDRKIIAPQLLPPWVKTRKDKNTGQLFVK